MKSPAPSAEGRHQVDAIMQRISKAVGFFIAPVPTDGSPSPATGLLIQVKGKQYFVTALHNFFHDYGNMEQVVKSWEETRFMFRDPRFGRTESMNEAAYQVRPQFGTMLSLYLSDDGLLIDKKHDLLAVRVDGSLDVFASAEFLDIEEQSFTQDLKTGVSLLMVGVTLSSVVDAPGFGKTLIPQMDHVRFDADIDTSGTTHEWYSPEYFFMQFSLAQDGYDAKGFSGAPIFVNRDPSPGELWMPSPRVAGIVLRYFRTKSLVIAVKIRTVIDLLEKSESLSEHS